MLFVPTPEKSKNDAGRYPPALSEPFLLVHFPRLPPRRTFSALRSMLALFGEWCIAASPIAALACALSCTGYDRPGPANLLVGIFARDFGVSFAT